MEKRPRYNLFIFLFYFWVENMLSPKIRDCPLNNSLDPQYLSIPVQWYRGGLIKILVRFRSNYYSYLKIFEKYLLKKVFGGLFSIKCFTYFPFHILILYFVLLILKHMFETAWLSV